MMFMEAERCSYPRVALPIAPNKGNARMQQAGFSCVINMSDAVEQTHLVESQD